MIQMAAFVGRVSSCRLICQVIETLSSQCRVVSMEWFYQLEI